MESLTDYNKRRRAEIDSRMKAMDAQKKNGIGCPTCGEELYDTDANGMTLSSFPPQKNVHCGCGYRGYRMA